MPYITRKTKIYYVPEEKKNRPSLGNNAHKAEE